jgi:ADP-ribose pyrophosphatase YjhB (NUDIX family)
LRGQTHESCSDITRIGIVFYNKKGILFHKSERTRFSQIIYAQYNFTQYKIPLEPKYPDEELKTACERIFKNITGVKLNNRFDEIAKEHKRRHRNGLCSSVFVIKTSQELEPPAGYTFMSYDDMVEKLNKPDNGQLLDYKLFSDLVREKRLTKLGDESSGTDGEEPSEKEIKDAIDLLFETKDKDLTEIINKFNKLNATNKYKAFEGKLKVANYTDYDDVIVDKARKLLHITNGQLLELSRPEPVLTGPAKL